jgi:type II secretory pathway pseudopilin PulG
MLISLMLIFALMAVALLAVLPSMKQQMQRDREDELRHRGTMYMRAIQRFYKKVGRYPTSFEELEQSNHIRYLRKRYKDPMSWDSQAHKERDFKPLHMQDVMLNNGPVLGQGPGGTPAPGGFPTPGGSPSPFPGPGGSPNGGGFQNTFGQTNQQGGTPSPSQDQANNPGNTDSSGSSNPGNAQGNSGSNSSGSSNPNNPAGTPKPGSGTGAPGPSGQVFGGGAIVGVASTNKKVKAIHEFNKKSHYTDWYFIYDPNSDRGGLLIGPWQPLTIQGGGIGQPIGAPGTGQQPGGGLGQGQGSFGQSGFGQSGGFGQSNPNPQNQQNPAGNPPEQPNQQ